LSATTSSSRVASDCTRATPARSAPSEVSRRATTRAPRPESKPYSCPRTVTPSNVRSPSTTKRPAPRPPRYLHVPQRPLPGPLLERGHRALHLRAFDQECRPGSNGEGPSPGSGEAHLHEVGVRAGLQDEAVPLRHTGREVRPPGLQVAPGPPHTPLALAR